MKKKLCMLMALLMVCLSAAACAETIELKVWSAQPDQALLEELCNAFAAEHPENEWKFTYGVVGEATRRPVIWRIPPQRRTCSPTRTTRSSSW